jgi:hypothetical protein
MTQTTLAKQEQMFMARVAANMLTASGEISFEKAARQVLDDDLRLFMNVCNNPKLRKDAVTHLSERTYQSIKQLSSNP